MEKYSFLLCFILCSIILSHLAPPTAVVAQPLSTNSRWIVDESGRRVKLACVNWVTHLEVVVAEGLSKQPVDMISKKIVDMGFNCVRLTWPLFLFTNDSLASLTVRQSFKNLGLVESIAGLQANNPSIVDLPLITAYQVFSSASFTGIQILLVMVSDNIRYYQHIIVLGIVSTRMIRYYLHKN